MKQPCAHHPQPWELLEGPGDLTGHRGSRVPSLGAAFWQKPSAEGIGALQRLLRLYLSLPRRFSCLCLMRHVHGVAAKCQAVSATHKAVVALTLKI